MFRGQRLDLYLLQEGEGLEQRQHLCVSGVQPELVERLRRGAIGSEPDRARFRLAKLAAVTLGEQRNGPAERVRLALLADQLYPRDDITPLIRAAHLHADAVAVE